MADKDFTPREMEIMAKAWNCMIEEPKVDSAKLAAACGMGNPRSATNAWRAIKAKIMAKGGITKEGGEGENGSEANGGEATPKAKATPKKRGKKAEEGEAGDESPTKKAKGGKSKKKVDSAEPEATGDGVKDEPAAEEDGAFQ